MKFLRRGWSRLTSCICSRASRRVSARRPRICLSSARSFFSSFSRCLVQKSTSQREPALLIITKLRSLPHGAGIGQKFVGFLRNLVEGLQLRRVADVGAFDKLVEIALVAPDAPQELID